MYQLLESIRDGSNKGCFSGVGLDGEAIHLCASDCFYAAVCSYAQYATPLNLRLPLYLRVPNDVIAESAKFLSPSPKSTSCVPPVDTASDKVAHRNPSATSPAYSHDSLASPRVGDDAVKTEARARPKAGESATEQCRAWRNPGDRRTQHRHLEEATLASARHSADVRQRHPHEFLHTHHAKTSPDEALSAECVDRAESSRSGADACFKASLRDLSVLEKQLDAALESQSGSTSLVLSQGEEERLSCPVPRRCLDEDLGSLKAKISKLEGELKCSEEIRQADELEKEMARRECASLAAQVETLSMHRDQLVRENQILLQEQKKREIRDEESEQDLQRSVEALRVSKDSLEQARLREKDLEQVCLHTHARAHTHTHTCNTQTHKHELEGFPCSRTELDAMPSSVFFQPAEAHGNLQRALYVQGAADRAAG